MLHRIFALGFSLLCCGLWLAAHVDARGGYGRARSFETPSRPGDGISGLTPEMSKLVKHTWEIDPFDYKKIKNKKLRNHIKTVLTDKPIRLKLDLNNLKNSPGGRRAMGYTSEGKKIRAKWTKGKRLPNSEAALNELSYDDALRSRVVAQLVDFELKLPPLPGRKELPSVVYSYVIDKGNVNPDAVMTVSRGRVTIYPRGKDNSLPGEEIDAGLTQANIGHMFPGLVDHGWAKGRKIFRKGRPVGFI